MKNKNRITHPRTINSNWGNIYKIAGISSIIILTLILLDIIMSSLSGGNVGPGVLSVIEWFALFQTNSFMALRNLGILNIINSILGIAIFLALYAIHKKINKQYATLAIGIFFVGITIYISNNVALPMLELSKQYATAITESQKSIIISAGKSLLVRGEDFTPGAFLGFFTTTLAYMLISFVMLKGKIFNKTTACFGIFNSLFLLIFAILTTFIPALFNIAMIFAAIGGLLLIVWYILIAKKFFQLGHQEKKENKLSIKDESL